MADIYEQLVSISVGGADTYEMIRNIPQSHKVYVTHLDGNVESSNLSGDVSSNHIDANVKSNHIDAELDGEIK